MPPTTVTNSPSSTEIPSSPSYASKTLSLRTLWSDTQSSLTRLLRGGLPSSGKSTASGSDSLVRFEISLPRRPGRPTPRRCPRGILVAVVCPPVAVYRVDRDLNARVWLTVALTLSGWLPGVAWWGGRTDALLTAPARPDSPYYWHTAERSSSVAAKGSEEPLYAAVKEADPSGPEPKRW
ncbi:hypothetical protein CGRA01v4_13078 [Colletotrichum graminicola]|nr:hypothetical protein CGRA01v4_13078 [Colletotrichum graminicola]